MARVVKKIVKNFYDKWVRILFHQSYFLKCCLLLTLFHQSHFILQHLDCKQFLIMLPDCLENMGKVALSDKVVLIVRL